MANRVLLPRALDGNGNIVPGAVAYFYENGTTTPLTVYSDEALTTAAGVSLAADEAGSFAARFIPNDCRIDIRDPDTNTSLPGYPSNDWHITTTDETGASSIAFTPITGNNATNVQDAIANLTALWNAVTSFGKSLIATANASAARALIVVGDHFTNATTIETGDTENIEDSGHFTADSAASNLPTGGGNWHVFANARQGGSVGLIALQQNGNNIYSRTRSGAVWNSWLRFATEDDVLGIGQSWSAPSRTASTDYQNTTGRPIEICIAGDSGAAVQVSSDGTTWVTLGTMNYNTAFSATIPDGHYYRTNGAYQYWSELR